MEREGVGGQETEGFQWRRRTAGGKSHPAPPAPGPGGTWGGGGGGAPAPRGLLAARSGGWRLSRPVVVVRPGRRAGGARPPSPIDRRRPDRPLCAGPAPCPAARLGRSDLDAADHAVSSPLV